MSDYVLDVSEADFELTVIAKSREVPVVVDFWAPWCGPCRTLGPVLERLAAEGQGTFVLAKLNVDENPTLSAQYNIRGIPAVKAFRDGAVVAEFTGALPEPRVREFIARLAPSEADRLLNVAQSFLATRHWAQAETSFRQVLAEQSAQGAAALGLVKALLAQGRGCEAEALIEDFPAGSEIVVAEKLKPLAHLLAEVEPNDPPLIETDLDALFYQSGRLLTRGQWEAGLDGLIETLRRDKKYRKGEPRLVLLGLFELFGEDDPRTREYRRELASVLF